MSNMDPTFTPMNPISLNTSSFVSRQVNYRAAGWGEGDSAANAFFEPLNSYVERFGALLDEIVALGFENIDLWTGHLNPNWATPEHVAMAREAVAQRGLQVVSLAGYFGDTVDQFEVACRLALSLQVPLLAGTARCLLQDRAGTLAMLHTYGLRLGLENEGLTAEGVYSVLGTGDVNMLGAVIDTASFDENGGDAVAAIKLLGPRIVQVHLRNCVSRTNPEAARFDTGLVPMNQVMQALHEVGYAGGLSIEHVAYQFDPREDCRFNLNWLRERL